MLVGALIHQRAWSGLEQEIVEVQGLLDPDVHSACAPVLDRLVEQVGSRLETDPNLPRVVRIARLVLTMARGRDDPKASARIVVIERFLEALREADRNWAGGRSPSGRKASAWLSDQARRAGISAEDARASVFETPEFWPVVAETIDPDAFSLVEWKVEVARAEADLAAGNHESARDRLSRLLDREPNRAEVHACLARVYKAIGQAGRVIEHLRAVVRAEDASPMAWNRLAWHLATGPTPGSAELLEALWAARRAVAIAPRSACWDTLAEVLTRLGDLPGAIEATREAIRLRPDHPANRERMRALIEALPGSSPSPIGSGAGPSAPGVTLPGKTVKDIFADTDFDIEIAPLEADHDDRTAEVERSSDFDLEESESGSEVFALDEDNVDPNAATAMRPANLDDDSDEFAIDDTGSGEILSQWDIKSKPGAPTAAPPKSKDQRGDPWFVRRVLGPFRQVVAAVAGSRPATDRVDFSLTAPAILAPGGSYALDVWAYVDARRADVMARARESQGTDDIRIKTKNEVVVARGVVLTVSLSIPTLVVADPDDVIDWDGKIGNATFPVSVPAGARAGPHPGTVSIHVDQLRLAKLHFVVEVGRGVARVAPLAAHEVRCKRAFASYASEDRDEVLGRLQGMLKVLPDLDLFLDVVSLRSGDRWEERLFQEIARREILYLFWSEAASRSHWVEREWRTALGLRGIAGIDPVPLVSPEEVPPPAELAQYLHFNDWHLAFSRGRRMSKCR